MRGCVVRCTLVGSLGIYPKEDVTAVGATVVVATFIIGFVGMVSKKGR